MIFDGTELELKKEVLDKRYEADEKRQVFVNSTGLNGIQNKVQRVSIMFSEDFRQCSFDSQIFAGSETFFADCKTLSSCADEKDR